MSKTVEASRVPLYALMSVYAAALFGSITILKSHHSLSLGIKSAVAILPMIPALLTIPLIIRRLRSLDEMQLRHHLESGAVASMICAFLALTYGFLERAGFPKLSMFVVWGVLGLSWIIASWIQRWRFS